MKTKKTILVVDDEKDILNLLSLILSEHWTILTALRVDAAREILDREHVDVIISDMAMPEVSGHELIKIGNQRGIPVVVLSGLPTPDVIPAGARKWISKPFSTHSLVAEIRQIVAAS
jgi:DNA-binding NtrC family response regulator